MFLLFTIFPIFILDVHSLLQYRFINHNQNLYNNIRLRERGGKYNSEYIYNIGNTIESLHRELPCVFVRKNLDFDIFSSKILVVVDGKTRVPVSKQAYIASVNLLRTIAFFSIQSPKINVRKIDYIEDTRTIQCLVEIPLPKYIKIRGQNKWEGYFYFGINDKGLIESHTFSTFIKSGTKDVSNVFFTFCCCCCIKK